MSLLTTTQRVFRGIFKAWPVVAFLPIALIHYLLITQPCYWQETCWDNQSIHKAVSFLSDFGIAVFTIGTFRHHLSLFMGTSICGEVRNWFKSTFQAAPPKGPIVNVKSSLPSLKASGSTTVTRPKNQTIEQRLDLLENQNRTLSVTIQELQKNSNQQIKRTTESMDNKHQELINTTMQNHDVVTKAFTSGMKTQLFGALLIIYGAVVNLAWLG